MRGVYEILLDETKVVHSLEVIGGYDVVNGFEVELPSSFGKVRLEYTHIDDNVTSGRGTNVVLAAFITAYARLRLYALLAPLGPNNVIYCDTDSGVIWQGDGIPQVDHGKYLGDFVSELPPGVHIDEFVALGPKSYAYKQSDDKIVIKVKGIHQSLATADVVKFDSMKTILETYHQPNNTTFQVPQRQFGRAHVPLASVSDVEQNKTWQFTFEKRQIVNHDEYLTLPYGY